MTEIADDIRDDIMQEFEHIAYGCDGESTGHFEDMLCGIDRLSPLEVAALSSFFLGRGMDDYARFLASHAWQLWAHQDKERPTARARWQLWKQHHPEEEARRQKFISILERMAAPRQTRQ